MGSASPSMRTSRDGRGAAGSVVPTSERTRACASSDAHRRARHQRLTRLVARRQAARLSTHRSSKLGGSVRGDGRRQGAARAHRLASGRHRSREARRARARLVRGDRRREGPGLSLRPEGPRSLEEAPRDRLDPRRRPQSELRRLARRAELRGVLLLSSVSAPAGLRRDRTGLPRQHRLREGVAAGCLRRRRREGLRGRDPGRDLSEDPRLRRSAIASASGD